MLYHANQTKRRTSLSNDKTDTKNNSKYFLLNHIERFSKNLSFLTNPKSVFQAVQELELCKEKHYIAKMQYFHKDCETEIGNVFTKTDNISKQKKIAIPD